jgi:hypothetical protein
VKTLLKEGKHRVTDMKRNKAVPDEATPLKVKDRGWLSLTGHRTAEVTVKKQKDKDFPKTNTSSS